MKKEAVSTPDLALGIRVADLPEGKPLACRLGNETVLVVRHGDEVHATGANCTHYGAPLTDGISVGSTLLCPWHHACFDLRTGKALAAPALEPIPVYELRRDGDRVVGTGRKKRIPLPQAPDSVPNSVLIVGAGPAGAVCAETLRREGYDGPICLIGDEAPGPVDRPNLSKDYLAGAAPEEWIPLRTASFYEENAIELLLGDPVLSVDTAAKTVRLRSGAERSYGALVLATGAVPRRLPIEGASLSHVHTLRSLADSRAIIEAAEKAKQAVVIGASFIGLEVAASLRQRQLPVQVVAPEDLPLGAVLGPQLGTWLRDLHAAKGVEFRLGRRPTKIDARQVHLDDGSSVPADLVVMGVGVSPRTELAEAAGLQVGDGVIVDATFRTSAPSVYAIGDVANLPVDGERQRIEHWAVAERQGQALARSLLGQTPTPILPFFWSRHYDHSIVCIGSLHGFEEAELHGSLEAGAAAVLYRRGGTIRGLAVLGGGTFALEAETLLRRGELRKLEERAASLGRG